MCRIAIIILFTLLSSAACFGQNSFKGLTSGQSTKADVERVLGQPVKDLSKTLVEYESSEEVLKVFVQYRDESPAAVVERIELTCSQVEGDAPNTCYTALNLWSLRGVLEDVNVGSRAGLKAYYGAPRFIVKTVSQKGPDGDLRLAYYSKKLYESAVPGGGCTGTIFGTWETERGRVTIRRVGDSGIQGTYARNNGTFSIKPERDDYDTDGYVGEWKDDTGSGTMALVTANDFTGVGFRASLSRGSEAAVPSNKRTENPSIGAIRPENREPEKLNQEKMLARDGLPPGEPLTGKCVP